MSWDFNLTFHYLILTVRITRTLWTISILKSTVTEVSGKLYYEETKYIDAEY